MSSGMAMKPTEETEHPQAHRLGYMLKEAQHALRLMMDERLEPLGLTTPQYNVLAAVESQPGISNAALARAAFVTAQSMLGIVANLERLRLIRRRAHPTHGRILISDLTSDGEVVLKSAHGLLKDIDETMTTAFKQGEIESLRTLLQRCTENMRAKR